MPAALERGDLIRWPQQQIPVMARTGVLVCGGGVAGIAAATAAGRSGADVLLLERNGFLGGIATAAGMAQWGSSAVGLSGMAGELLDRLVSAGAAIRGPVIPIDPEAFKDVAYEMVSEAGSRILLYAQILDAVLERGSLRGAVVATKAGPRAVLAEAAIDATGDADLAFFAGAPFVKGRETDGKMRPATLLFRLGNVDVPQVVQFARDNPGDFLNDPDRSVIDPEGKLLRLVGFFSQVDEASARGELDPECHYLRLEDVFFDRRLVTVNTTRMYGIDGTDPVDLTRATVEGRRQMRQLVAFLRRYIPGFQDSFLVDSAPSLGVRETRRIVGQYVLTEEDIAADRPFADTVARLYVRHLPGHDVHSPDAREGAPEDVLYRSEVLPIYGYSFPFRCLVPQRVEGLLVAGRCASVTQEADRCTRNQPPCILMGQAAGTAAAAAVDHGVYPQSVDVEQLQRSLRFQGVDLG